MYTERGDTMKVESSGMGTVDEEITLASRGFANNKPIIVTKTTPPSLMPLIIFFFCLFGASYINASLQIYKTQLEVHLQEMKCEPSTSKH
jgi:hypothetical protein